jgi:uncharacterized membrane protein
VYDASVAIHVAAAIVGFGATFSYPVIQIVAELRDPDSLPLAMDTILAVSRWVAVPATLVVGATGAYQAAAGPYDFGDAWLATGAALYVAVMLVSILYLAPAYRRARDAARATAGRSDEYKAAIRGVSIVGPLVAAAVVAIAVLMELKPA